MTRLARIAGIAAILTISALCTPARAGTISLAAGSSSSFDVAWSLLVEGVELSATATFDVTVADSGDSAAFLITLTNTTAAALKERAVSVGFSVDPDAVALTDTVAGTIFDKFALSTKFLSGYTIDVCAWSKDNCSGGALGAALAGGGASDTFGFTLVGDFAGGMTLSDFAIKFQGNVGSYRVFEGGTTTVPEYESSASFLLIGLGFVAAFGAVRHRIDRPALS